MRVIVLGATGMLGSLVLDTLQGQQGLQVVGTTREFFSEPTGVWRVLDAVGAEALELERVLEGADWAINCIGLIKHRMRQNNGSDVVAALEVNALFPHRLAKAAERQGCKVLQIATDCVYSGAKGGYLESDPHDAHDVYGKTKSLGEVQAQGFYNLRCSIVGPEKRNALSLLEWLLGQPRGGRIKGFVNHMWNGVTTLHFARICAGVIQSGMTLPPLVHLVPFDSMSKAGMLHAFAANFGRGDLQIEDVPASAAVDRTLGTLNPDLNRRLWGAAGYLEPPTIAGMIGELACSMTSPRGEQL